VEGAICFEIVRESLRARNRIEFGGYTKRTETYDDIHRPLRD